LIWVFVNILIGGAVVADDWADEPELLGAGTLVSVLCVAMGMMPLEAELAFTEAAIIELELTADLMPVAVAGVVVDEGTVKEAVDDAELDESVVVFELVEVLGSGSVKV
jgi:hypothetical protein